MADRISRILGWIDAPGSRWHGSAHVTDILDGLGISWPDFSSAVARPQSPQPAAPDAIPAGLVAHEAAMSAVAPSAIQPAGRNGGGGPTSGNDTLTGTSADNTISGLGGNDTISGLAGNDTLAGNAGADTIDGGDGNDMLYSGDASPTFTSPVLDTGTDIDTLKGGLGDDTLFAGYGDNVDGGDGMDRLFISFQAAAAGIHFDMGLAAQVIGGGTITNVESVSWLQGSNYDDYVNLDGSTGYENSVVLGMAGNDTLIAGYYTGTLDGGDGNDVLDARNSLYLQEADGGLGNDTIYVGTAGAAYGGDGDDVIHSEGQAHGGNGADTIILTSAYGFGGAAYGDAGNDQITGSDKGDYIEGNDDSDTLRGGAGDDTIDGGAGADLISGDLGDDQLVGGAGNDIFQFGQAGGKDVITDFASGDVVQVSGYGHAQSVTQAGSDVVVVFSSSDQITFLNATVAAVQGGLQFVPATNDTLAGGPGDDYVHGYGGNDTISGNEGNDTLAGGAGADTIDGGAGDDLIFSGDVALAPWDLSNPPILDRGAEVDTINGGDGSDTIFAGYGDNVDGGADGDRGDTIYLSFQAATAGVHFDGHLATQTIGGGTISGIENIGWVEGSNYGDDIDAGTATNSGYSPNTQIYGMGGDDTLIAGVRTALLDGGDGNDVVDGRNSENLSEIDGGAGDDTIYTNPGNLPSWPYALSVNGGDGNDTISANGNIHGGAGDDVINVLASSYSGPVSGDGGNDAIHGSEIADTIDGGAGNDAIDGGGGDDALTGGAGDDVLTGGDGNDQFLVGEGNDVITDFTAGDVLEVKTGFSADAIRQVGSDVVITLDGGNTLTFANCDVASVQAALHSVQVNDMAISADSSTVYVAGGDGNLYSYSAATGDLIRAWHVGGELGGMDISPDGSFAIVTDLQPVQNGTANGYPTYTMVVHMVDLETGAVTDFEYESHDFTEYSFYDAAVTNDGKVLLAEQMPPGWSGGSPTRVLDLQTGSFTSIPVDWASREVLSDSPDGSTALIMAEDTSDAPLFLYQAGSGIVASHQLYADDISGFNQGVQAYSAQAGLVAQGLGNSINIYNGQLQYQFDLGQLHPELSTGAVGLAFDSTGHYLFVLNAEDDTIYKVSTSDWSVVSTIAVGTDVTGFDGAFGDRLLLAPDGSYFTVMTGDGWVKVDGTPSAGSTLNGTSADDRLNGTSGSDTINGLDGADTIYAGDGSDSVSGGAGHDYIHAGSGDDVVHAGDGSSALVPDFIWDGPGNDTVYGGRDSDVIYGSPGNDYYDGGTGATLGVDLDSVDYSAAAAGIVVDMRLSVNQVHSSGSGDPANVGVDTLVNIEAVTGSAFDDVMYARNGGFILDGAGGNDMLFSGSGNDRLTGGDGTDTVSYATAGAGVSVSLAITAAQNTLGAGTDTLGGFENLVGSNYADLLTGDGGANSLSGGGGADTLVGGSGNDMLSGGTGNDTLRGGLGDDALAGGAGSDTYYVESAGDTVTENSGEGTDTVISSIGWTLGPNVELLTLTGTANIDGTGNALANTLTGNSGDNHLYGLDGNDSLKGSAGNDWLDGGAGNDSLNGGAGDDSMTGGAGNDTYYVDSIGDTVAENAGEGEDGVLSTVSWTLGANVELLTLTGSANLDGTGNALANTISGNLGNNHLYGGGGSDTLKGSAGSDWLEGGAGRDFLTGGTGADQFVFRDGDFGSTPSTADNIADFSSADGDKVNLQFVDSNLGSAGDQAFTFIGTDSFHHLAGELRYQQVNGLTVIYGDMNGDGVADMMITLSGTHTLTGGDFVL